MTGRVRRRVGRDRRQDETTAEERAFFAWHSAWTKRKVGTLPDDPDYDVVLAESIRYRGWCNARWDQFKEQGVPMREAQRLMRVIPPPEVVQ